MPRRRLSRPLFNGIMTTPVGDYEANPGNDDDACQLGRACFDRAEYSRDSSERAALANEGIAACRRVIARQPNLAAGHYYLAMNMAQLARTKLLGAFPLLSHMEAGWKTALALDERMDYAGPDRYLGLLYRDAPAGPSAWATRPRLKSICIGRSNYARIFPKII